MSRNSALSELRSRSHGSSPAVEELQRLHDELDLADTAAPQLDVGVPRLPPPAQLAVDALLHGPDGRQDALVHAGPVDDVAGEVHEARAHARVPGRHPRLEQRLALPRLGALPVVGPVAVERQRDGARAPLGAQPQVDAEDVALVGDRLDDGRHIAAHAGEVLAVGDPALGAAGRLALGAVDEHQIDVRRVVQLLAAQLAHADHCPAGLLPRLVERRADAGPHLGLGHPPGFAQAGVGQPGQLLGGHAEVGVAEQVAGADAEHVTILEAPQRVHAGLAGRERRQRLGEVGREVIGEPHSHRLRLQQPGQRDRPSPERIGQELAAAAEPGQQVGGPGVIGQRAEEHRPVDAFGITLEVVERHVGIGRPRQLREQPRQRRRQQLRIPRRRRQRLQIRARRPRILEPQTPERPHPPLRRRRPQQIIGKHYLDSALGSRGGALPPPR